MSGSWRSCIFIIRGELGVEGMLLGREGMLLGKDGMLLGVDGKVC